MSRRIVTRADLILLLCLLVIVLTLWLVLLPREEGDTVSVYVGDTLCAEFSLSESVDGYTVTTEKGSLSLTLRDGEAWVTHADCPDAVCVRTGRISKKGESIVCAPLGVCVTVEGGTLDGVTG